MEGENESQAHENNSQQATGIPVTPQEPNPDPTRGAAESQPQKWYAILKKPILPQVEWAEVFGALGVVIGGLVCYIYWNQLQVMSGQLAEMQGGTSQTSQLIVNAAHQASGIHDLAVAAKRQADQAVIQAKAARVSADAANASIRTSQQSYVTVGRQDGTVAEIVWPKNPEGKAGILVYFRNNGHLPAKFNWGTQSEIIAVLPNDPNLPVGSPKASMSDRYEVRTNNVFRPMWRARNRKTGNFVGSGATMIGGDSLYAGDLWEAPKDRMVQMQNSALWTVGIFEYCDAFHNYVCRNFMLIYRREPYNRFVVVSEDECLGPEHTIPPDPDLEYLSPCATGTEREETRIFQSIKDRIYPER
jgi:hypothetical protein